MDEPFNPNTACKQTIRAGTHLKVRPRAAPHSFETPDARGAKPRRHPRGNRAGFTQPDFKKLYAALHTHFPSTSRHMMETMETTPHHTAKSCSGPCPGLIGGSASNPHSSNLSQLEFTYLSHMYHQVYPTPDAMKAKLQAHPPGSPQSQHSVSAVAFFSERDHLNRGLGPGGKPAGGGSSPLRRAHRSGKHPP